ncbi:MAG: hypothetical protein DRP47_00920 [Candidatus Zixiibacteriota bacterium]|nr:MAG: hypothetical protein DRP47_00920 [candidate division Zixibacteria bacterium]
MKLRKTFGLFFALGLIVAVAIVLIVGCDGSSGPVDPFNNDYEYQLGGVLIKDYNRNAAYALARLERNDTLVIGAVITIDGDTLTPSGSTYFYAVGPADSLPSGAIDVSVKDSSRFHDTLAFTIPGNLSILSVSPPVKGPSDQVSVNWTGAADADGYIVAAVKKDSAYMGLGYSQWVTSQTTSISINDSAFTTTTIQGDEPNPGIYYIYIYAYNGVPDSTLLSALLPTSIPNQLDDNITEKNLNGTIGSIVTTLFGTVEVVAE